MGKQLETLGIIDGFDIIELGKIKVKKDKIFSEIQKYDKNIVDEVRDMVNNNKGYIMAIVKHGIIYGLYVFKVEIENNISNLKYIKTIYTDDVKEETRKKYDDLLLELLKDSVSYQEYDKVIYKDEVIKLNEKSDKKLNIITLFGEFIIGFIMGYVATEEIMFGIAIGIIFSTITSGLDVVVQKKRGRKSKTKSKKH